MPKDRFEYQRPDDDMVARITQVRELCSRLDDVLEAFPMEPRCRALARTKLEEVSMWANKGIVFYEEQQDA